MNWGLVFILGSIISVAVIWWINASNSRQQRERQEEQGRIVQADIKANKADYEKVLKQINVPADAKVLTGGKGYIGQRTSFFVWKVDGHLHIFPKIDNDKEFVYHASYYAEVTNGWYRVKEYSHLDIPMDNIRYFAPEGELHTETKVSGGGSSLKGAVVGGVIAGGAGAVIASRKEVKSETLQHDTRVIELHYLNDAGEGKVFAFMPDARETLLELIPDKDYAAISIASNRVAQSTSDNTVAEKIRQLDALKKEGLITQEEYLGKKSELLDSI